MDAIKFLKQLVEEIEKMENCGQVSIEKQENLASTLTEQQKTAIRGRIAEGYPWVVRDGNEYECVWFFENEPKMQKSGEIYTDVGKCADVTSKVYDFVTFENSPLYLPDLLGGEE